MAYTNNNGQARVGVRIVPLSVVIPTISTLLDSYSGAAAAYSLRKLSATWSGSAIRVRRSSDNTEMNIGFDAGGNLDTIALSSFVGSGSGFVTTWYDQTGNNFNRTQTTAAAQPNIVYLGAINMVNGKPAMYFDGTATTFATQGPRIGDSYMGAGYSSTVLDVTKLDSSYSTTEEYPLFGGTGWYDSRFSIYNNKWYLTNSASNALTTPAISSTVNASANQVVSSVVFATIDKVRINGTQVISGDVGNNGGTDYNYIGQSYLGKRYKGYFQEHIIYASDKTSVISAMETNMNTYYSAYPNPTSVWNLLNAVYSADTTASSSLKTSLVASYNGESNANDSFGTNNGTAVGGLSYGTGKIGNAFVFNGSNSYVSLTNSSNLTGNFSISVWINPSVQGSYNTIFEDAFLSTGTNRYGIALYIQGSRVKFATYNGTGNLAYGNTSTISNNTWQHIVITKTTGNAWKMYINNTLQSLITVVGDITTNPGVNVNSQANIGSDLDIGVRAGYFNGSIDALNIWSKELTASEVSELYNSGNGAQYIGDNFYKPTTNDALGTNNGTAVGGLTYGLGKVGTAFQFNGTNAAVRLPDNSLNSLTGDFSISGWVYLPPTYLGTGGATVYMLWNVTATTWANNLKGITLRITSNTIVGFTIWDGVSSASVSFNDNVSTYLKNNSWVHITATRKGSTGSKLYLNGVLVSSNTSTMNPVYSSTFQTPNIGNLRTTNSSGTVLINNDFAFNGTKIDGLSVWSKELTQTEVTELYNSGNGKQYPN